MTKMEANLKERMEALQRQMQAELKARVEVKERQFQDVVLRLKTEAQQGGSRLRIVGDALEDLRVEFDEPKVEVKEEKSSIPGAMGARDPLSTGDWVMVLADPPWHGLKGQVERLHLAQGSAAPRVSVRMGTTGKLKDFYKTELKRTQAPPQSVRKLKKPQGEAAAPTRNYSNTMF
eukprot:symbB.v1.2.032535.t1/scaffold3918.1/size48325/3